MTIRSSAAFLSLALLCFSAACFAAGDGWEPSYAAALKKGKELNKPILIEFTNPHCGECAKMEQRVFTLPVIKATMDKFVKVKANTDEPELDAIRKRHGLDQMPAFLYLRPTGKPAYKNCDVPRLPDEFLADMKGVLKKEAAIAKAKKMLEVSPTSKSAMYRLGVAYADAGEDGLARELFEKVVAAGGSGKPVAGASFHMAKAYAAEGQAAKAAKLLDNVLKLDPKNTLKLADQALLERGKIAMKQGQFGNAYRCFSKIIKIYDQNKKVVTEAQMLLGECRRRLGG